MKVYFNASLFGKEKYSEEFNLIIECVKKSGHEIYAEHVMKRDFKVVNKQGKEQHEADFQRARKEIQKSDFVIAEATSPSIGVGYIISIALELYKPVLILYQNTPHGLLMGDPNRLLTVKKYSLKDAVRLKRIIQLFLEKAKNRLLKKRFNFMLDKIQEDYLEWISRQETMSKANFIRQLIDKNMQKNKEYKNF